MIEECRCPDCGEYCHNYYDGANPPEICDSDTIFIDYDVHCKCGCKFTYTEWYKLSDTEIARQ